MRAFEFFEKKKLLLVAVAFTVIVMGALIGGASIDGKKSTPEKRYISGTIVETSLDDLFEQSTLAVFGTVTGKSDAFQIKGVSGSVANFTDYYLNISSTLRGTAKNNAITVRVQGGTVGNYTEIYEFSPNLEINNDYLLFLYKPGRGGAYNTEGDYYYVLGLTQGVFSENENGDFVSASGEILSQERLISTLSDEDMEPVNENYFRNEYIENQERNLQNGFITQEEFDEMMANIDHYATILD